MEFFISNAYAQGAQQGDAFSFLLPMLIIFGAFYFLLICPQQKRQKAHAALVGGFAAGLTLAIGQALIILVRPLWARFVIALTFVVPAVLAGFYATLGITRTMMPSETWQMIFAVIGAGVVGVSAFLRIARMAADTSDGSAVGA